MMTQIKAVVFDLGGVLYNIDYQLTQSALSALSGSANVDFAFNSQHPIFSLYESGKCTTSEFRISVKEIYNIKCSDEEFDRAWNALLKGLLPDRVQLIKNCSSRFKTALLSNINEIHLAAISSDCSEIFSYFDKKYLSFEVGDRKPNPEIYQLVQDDLKVTGNEILFFDDLLANCEAAKKLGWNTVLIKAGDKSTQQFSDLLTVL